MTCVLASVLSLATISLDRLLGIVRPFSRRLSKREAIYVVVGVWVLALGLASPLAVLRKFRHRQWNDFLEVRVEYQHSSH